MADPVDPKVEEQKKLDELKKKLDAEKAQFEKDKKAFEDAQKDGVVPTPKLGGITIPLTFANVTNVSYGGTIFGGVSSIRISPRFTRIEPMTNDVYTGPIASMIGNKTYEVSIETEDFNSSTLASSTAVAQTLTFTAVPTANTIGGTTLTAGTVTITSLVNDGPDYTFNSKKPGTIALKMHTLGTTDNSDQMTMTV